MATENILSQDEIDALLSGMDGGDVETRPEEETPSMASTHTTSRVRIALSVVAYLPWR